MFDRLVEDFCQFDDFCQAFGPHWQARLLNEEAQPAKKRGPQPGLVDSEIMTILVLYHSSSFSNFKAFYEGVVLTLLRAAFPKPAYQPRDPTQVADFRGSDGGSGRMAAIRPTTRGKSTAAAKIVLLDQWV